jgi:hypothetical protein
MNPWAVILILIGIGALVISYKGTQNIFFAAVSPKTQWGDTTLPNGIAGVPVPNTPITYG